MIAVRRPQVLSLRCYLSKFVSKVLSCNSQSCKQSGRLVTMSNCDASSSSSSELSFADRIKKSREDAGTIDEFKFKKQRLRTLSKAEDVPDGMKGIVYWMFREQRVDDNWALLYAQKLALKEELPLYVVHCTLPAFLGSPIRQYKFSYFGLKEVVHTLKKKNICYFELDGYPHETIPKFITDNEMGALVCEFFPLRCAREWTEAIMKKIGRDIPVIQVDAHNVVPCWVTSQKQEFAARTIRNKVNSKVPEFLTPFPDVLRHPHDPELKQPKIDFDEVVANLDADSSIDHAEWLTPGPAAGIAMLEKFCLKKLKKYAEGRNDPTENNLSNLSPYFHFGQLAPQRACYEVAQFKKTHKASVEAFLEEAIVRRELSDNFCHYNKHYDSVEGAADWAKKTLDAHRKDKREYIYSESQFEKAKTHDDLWNAGQRQLVREGKMHGFLRMYWAKKILEWTASPEDALAIAIYLNDKYSYDGRDPNGYVGCSWSVCGTHDRPWANRPVFGMVRYMNYAGCKRKFDVAAYVRKYR